MYYNRIDATIQEGTILWK